MNGITRDEAVRGWCEDTIKVEADGVMAPMVELGMSDMVDLLRQIASTKHNLISYEEVAKITNVKEAEDLIRMVMISLTKKHYADQKEH